MEEYVIIVAGGTGKRMKSDLPKQFILVNNKPIILHTINKFIDYNKDIKLVIAMQKNYFDYWKTLCKTYGFNKKHQLIEAGKERYFTVKNALNDIPYSEGIVAIHDAVRPMVNIATIRQCYAKAKEKGNAIPIVPLTNSIRKITKTKNKSVERTNYVAVQTPQCFKISLIKEAYQQSYKKSFTDDASVYESFGGEIITVEGNSDNKKITTPLDIIIAKNLL